MNASDREVFFRGLFDECLAIAKRKGSDYSENKPNADVNSNFKLAAERLSTDARPITKYDIWFVYFYKHLTAIETFIATGKLESEGIRGRIIDAINYLVILGSMVKEDEQANPQK